MKRAIANILLNTQAVFLSPEKPFRWASGIMSPIYCDNRRVLAFPKERGAIKQQLAQVLEAYEYDAIMGTATAGIPMASILADYVNKPLGYVRSSQKAHGRNQQIEGFHQAGSKVIVIEDLISTGKSVLEVVDVLEKAEMEVVAVVGIFSYQLQAAKEAFQQRNLTYVTLSDFETLTQVALETNRITHANVEQLKAFQTDPTGWQA